MMAAKYGYGRVSTRGQKLYGNSLDEQRDKLVEVGVPEENIYIDACTGTKMFRPQLDKLLAVLSTGDELVVCKLDRFARTAAEGSTLIKELVSKGIRVNILNMGIADNTPMGKVMVTVMLAFAEFERDMIVERTSAGKAYAKEHDPEFKEGRPRKNVIYELMDGESVSAACERLGISRTQWYRAKKRQLGQRPA